MGYPRIQYNSINVDFDRHFNEFEISREEKKSENEADSGVIETIGFWERWKIAAVKERIKAELIDQLEEFWRYCKTGASFKFWKDMYLGLYLAFEGKSLKTNDELDATFARSGVANVVDPSTGLVSEIAENYARFPSGKFGRGLLIEGTKQNILTYSEQLNHANWAATNVTVGANTTETLDPAGGSTAEKLTAIAANGDLTQNIATAIGTDDGCFSIWLKAQTQSTTGITLYIKDSTGATLASQDCTITTQWVRYSAAYNSPGNNANNWRVVIEMNTNGDILYGWGAQLEVGAHRRFASGYVKTTTAAAARSNESCYWNITENLEFGALEGTVSFWIKPEWLYNEGGGAGGDPVRMLLNVVDSSGGTVLEITRNASSQIVATFYAPDGTTTVSATAAATLVTQNIWAHIVLTWDLTQSNMVKLYINGALVNTSTSSPMTIKIADKIYLGSSDTPDQHADAVFDEVLFLTEEKDSIFVSWLYAYARALGYRRNYFSSLMLDDAEFNPVIQSGSNIYDFELNAKEILS